MSTPRTMPLLILLAILAFPVRAQVVPDGITVEPVATGLSVPTGFDFLPDGRVIYVEQFTARVRVLTVGTGVQVTPLISVTGVNAGGERGLLGIAFDPSFASNHFVYVYYTTNAATPVNRVSKFTANPANPNVALAGETVLLDNIASTMGNHNGGARFILILVPPSVLSGGTQKWAKTP